jgi:hypothetical protein
LYESSCWMIGMRSEFGLCLLVSRILALMSPTLESAGAVTEKD